MPKGCLRALSAAAFLAACGLLLVRCACMREMSGDGPPPPESKGPWTVNGVPLGATEAECRAVLGDGAEPLRSRAGTTSLIWRNRPGRDVCITLDANGAADVYGDVLADSSGTPVVGSGTSPEDVRAILPRARERKHYRPKGSGVISIGREHIGTSYTWTDGGAAFEIGFSKDGFTYVRAVRAR